MFQGLESHRHCQGHWLCLLGLAQGTPRSSAHRPWALPAFHSFSCSVNFYQRARCVLESNAQTGHFLRWNGANFCLRLYFPKCWNTWYLRWVPVLPWEMSEQPDVWLHYRNLCDIQGSHIARLHWKITSKDYFFLFRGKVNGFFASRWWISFQ